MSYGAAASSTRSPARIVSSSIQSAIFRAGSPEEPHERVALDLVLPGIRLVEPLQVHQLPANGWQVRGFGHADQVEIRLGIVQGKQEGSDVASQPRTDVGMQAATRFDQGIPGYGLASHPHEILRHTTPR